MRLWGRTIYDQPGDIAQEVLKAFSNKPCFGVCNENELTGLNDVVEQEFPTRRYVSRECTLWSADTYENTQNFYPAMCQSCKNILPKGEVPSYGEYIENADESQAKKVPHPGEMLRVDMDLDSELINDEEDFSDMHPDDKNIASDAEIEATRTVSGLDF